VNRILLSHRLDGATPSYGNRERFVLTRTSDIAAGDVATNSRISTGVHVGTHVDLPAHFHGCGQEVEAFPAPFWFFDRPLLVEVQPKGTVIHEELLERLAKVEERDYDLLLVKTGIGARRGEESYWRENYGFHPELCDAIRTWLPKVRLFGFDSISVSSFADRATGREAHRCFLDPVGPLLLLEDMDLGGVGEAAPLEQVVVAPLFIAGCEALPCTVYGVLRD